MGVEADGEHCAGHDLGLRVVLRNDVVKGLPALKRQSAQRLLVHNGYRTGHLSRVYSRCRCAGVVFGEQALGVRLAAAAQPGASAISRSAPSALVTALLRTADVISALMLLRHKGSCDG
jgi:hypothetical protein